MIEEIVKQTKDSDRIVSPSSLYLKFQNLSPEEKRYLDNQGKKLLGLFDEEKRKTAVHIKDNRFFLDIEKFKKNQSIVKESFNKYNKKPVKEKLFNLNENSSDLSKQ